MIVDCHVHLNNYTRRPVPTEQNFERLLNRMKRYRVDHAVVLSSYLINEDRPSVERVLDLVGDDPRISVVEGITFDDDEPADLEGLERRLEAGKVVGIKMYPGYLPFYPQDPVCEPVYELAQEHGVPVMFHTGDTFARGAKVKYSHPIHIDEVAVDHPKMTVIMCHLGNPWFRDAAEVVYKNENAYADISGLVLEGFEENLERWLADDIRELIAYAGDPYSLLYGTDWPLVKMGPYLNFVRSLGLTEKEEELILWRNANKLFQLKLLSPTRKRRLEAARKPATSTRKRKGAKRKADGKRTRKGSPRSRRWPVPGTYPPHADFEEEEPT